MTTLFLIAHKVRGEQAFDVATRMTCPLCIEGETDGCAECEGLGYWWIIPTSGHRAYPYYDCGLEYLDIGFNTFLPPPDHLPDHYQVSAAPKGQGQIDASNLLRTLGLTQKIDPSIRRF